MSEESKSIYSDSRLLNFISKLVRRAGVQI